MAEQLLHDGDGRVGGRSGLRPTSAAAARAWRRGGGTRAGTATAGASSSSSSSRLRPRRLARPLLLRLPRPLRAPRRPRHPRPRRRHTRRRLRIRARSLRAGSRGRGSRPWSAWASTSIVTSSRSSPSSSRAFSIASSAVRSPQRFPPRFPFFLRLPPDGRPGGGLAGSSRSCSRRAVARFGAVSSAARAATAGAPNRPLKRFSGFRAPTPR